MYIAPCPQCGRMPKIQEARRLKDGTRRWFIGCPNYCSVLRPQQESMHNSGLFWLKASWLVVYGDVDKNTIYKQWNQELDFS